MQGRSKLISISNAEMAVKAGMLETELRYTRGVRNYEGWWSRKVIPQGDGSFFVTDEWELDDGLDVI